MKKRARYHMVDEDDPQWCRFWDIYPHRVSKKDARKAWMDLHPTPETVTRMLDTLRWQIEDWARKAAWYTPPYPASWLRAERWTDEAPASMRRTEQPDLRGHIPQCRTQQECIAKVLADARKDKTQAS